jgi:hypothetical protein
MQSATPRFQSPAVADSAQQKKPPSICGRGPIAGRVVVPPHFAPTGGPLPVRLGCAGVRRSPLQSRAWRRAAIVGARQVSPACLSRPPACLARLPVSPAACAGCTLAETVARYRAHPVAGYSGSLRFTGRLRGVWRKTSAATLAASVSLSDAPIALPHVPHRHHAYDVDCSQVYHAGAMGARALTHRKRQKTGECGEPHPPIVFAVPPSRPGSASRALAPLSQCLDGLDRRGQPGWHSQDSS